MRNSKGRRRSSFELAYYIGALEAAQKEIRELRSSLDQAVMRAALIASRLENQVPALIESLAAGPWQPVQWYPTDGSPVLVSFKTGRCAVCMWHPPDNMDGYWHLCSGGEPTERIEDEAIAWSELFPIGGNGEVKPR